MDTGVILLLALAGVVILAAAAKAYALPLRLFWKAAANTVLGLGALVVVNATTAFTGLSLGINFFNALVVGILGVPGLVLLLLVQWVVT